MSLCTIQEGRCQDLLRGESLVVIEFGAVWCAPCKQLLPILEQLSEEFGSKATFAKVDVDQAPDLAVSYGIMGMPTVIVFKNAEPVEKLVGLRPKEAYKAVIGRYLD
jgi:thioredoxin 1